jgi:WXG100 family type VII secretion target
VTGFEIDLSMLDATARDLEALERFVDERLSELDQVIADLHVTWTGQAARAHAVAHREWAAGARRMREGLQAMRLAAQSAHADYLTAAEANSTMWMAMR